MAVKGEREFRRLRGIDLKSYNFSHIFVDPPRSGLDDISRMLVKDFENIIYISCNPLTLKRDLDELKDLFEVKSFALFDQFAYTNHIECGVVLTKKDRV
jgi:tRNA (uracil-5-)-methyltransferase